MIFFFLLAWVKGIDMCIEVQAIDVSETEAK